MYFWRGTTILGIETVIRETTEYNFSEMKKDPNVHVGRAYKFHMKLMERKPH